MGCRFESLANIHFTVRTEDTTLPCESYTIDQEFLARVDNPGRYISHVNLSFVEYSWNRNDVISDTRILILLDSGNIADVPEVMLLKDVTYLNLPETTLLQRHRFARAFEMQTGISPELAIFYGLNDQIERQGITEIMRRMIPTEATQIGQYAEQIWSEMEIIMTDL